MKPQYIELLQTIRNDAYKLGFMDGKEQEKAEHTAMAHKPKMGHWIASDISNEKYVCSECGGACWYYDHKGNVAKSRYCPNCGAKMIDKFNVEVHKI